ncbi:MAG: zinc ABC transporter substrate-binding protein [Verrucomicrobia subdivision 3 bacterium]|nr:zinc ABC transporter substrate-binding protein [Limisphaerales bacterium]
MKQFIYLPIIILLGCKPAVTGPAPQADKLRVAVVNFPLAYFVERIAGDLVEVHFPDMEGDPAFWKPTAAEVRAFQSSDLILLNGASYAKWTAWTSLPDSRTTNTSTAFCEAFIAVKTDAAHQHGKGGEHSHAGTAFTTWLDFKQAQHQAAAVHRALMNVLPAHSQRLANNFVALQRDLVSLDADLRGIAADLGDTPLLGSHPVYQYLARGYELNIRSVHWEPDTMPDEAGWAELAALRKTHPAKVMLWEDAPNQVIIAKLKTRGIRTVIFAPCANRAASDWLTVMRENVAALREMQQLE